VNEQALKVEDLEHTSVYWLKAVGSITITFTLFTFVLQCFHICLIFLSEKNPAAAGYFNWSNIILTSRVVLHLLCTVHVHGHCTFQDLGVEEYGKSNVWT